MYYAHGCIKISYGAYVIAHRSYSIRQKQLREEYIEYFADDVKHRLKNSFTLYTINYKDE